MKSRGLIYTTLFTFVVAFLFVAVLALTNEATRDRTELNRELFEKRAVLGALGIAYEDPQEITTLYDSEVREIPAEGLAVYAARIDGEERSGVRFSGAGLWGTITGVLALNAELSRTAGFEIIDHNETPGLGGRITESWFKEQFAGERIPEDGIRIRGGGDTDTENGIVDAVTGATRTSRALEGILNESILALRGALR